MPAFNADTDDPGRSASPVAEPATPSGGSTSEGVEIERIGETFTFGGTGVGG